MNLFKKDPTIILSNSIDEVDNKSNTTLQKLYNINTTVNKIDQLYNSDISIKRILDYLKLKFTSIDNSISGTPNYLSKFISSGTIGNSTISDDGTNILAAPSSQLQIIGGGVWNPITESGGRVPGVSIRGGIRVGDIAAAPFGVPAGKTNPATRPKLELQSRTTEHTGEFQSFYCPDIMLTLIDDSFHYTPNGVAGLSNTDQATLRSESYYQMSQWGSQIREWFVSLGDQESLTSTFIQDTITSIDYPSQKWTFFQKHVGTGILESLSATKKVWQIVNNTTPILTLFGNGNISITGSLTASISALVSTGSTFLTHTAGLIQSRTAAQVLSDIDGAASSHTHTTTDITSGTLGVASGGTGISSFTTGNFIYASGSTTLAQYTPSQVRTAISAEPSISTGSISQYWRGDKSWQDFNTSARGACFGALTSLSIPFYYGSLLEDSMLSTDNSYTITYQSKDSLHTLRLVLKSARTYLTQSVSDFVFSGQINSTANYSDLAYITGAKEDAVNGHLNGQLSLKVTDSLGNIAEVIKITGSNSLVTISGGLDVSAGNVQVGSINSYLRMIAGSAQSSVTNNMRGLEIGQGNGTNNYYGAGIKFVSYDSAFTTTNPKMIAAIIPRCRETYSNDYSGASALYFYTTPHGVAGTGEAMNLQIAMVIDYDQAVKTYNGFSASSDNGGNKSLYVIDTREYNNYPEESIVFQNKYTSSYYDAAQIRVGKSNHTSGNKDSYFAIDTCTDSGGMAQRFHIDENGYCIFDGGVGVGATDYLGSYALQLKNQIYWGGIATAWNTYACSEKWKTDIAVISDSASKLSTLSGIEFTHNKGDAMDGVRAIGITAEQLDSLELPGLVGKDKDGNYLHVNLVGLIPILVNAVNELNTKIETLLEKGVTV